MSPHTYYGVCRPKFSKIDKKDFCLVSCKSPYVKVYGIHRIYNPVTICQKYALVTVAPENCALISSPRIQTKIPI